MPFSIMYYWMAIKHRSIANSIPQERPRVLTLKALGLNKENLNRTIFEV